MNRFCLTTYTLLAAARATFRPLACSVALMFLVIGAHADPTTWHVALDGSGHFTSIQAAIDNPSVLEADIIIVAPGTYVESLSWSGKNLTIQAASVLQGAQVGPSTIDPNSNGRCLYTSGLSSASRIEGFTFQNGRVSGVNFPDGVAGGMFNDHSSPTITNCIFSGNQALDASAGGMFNYFSSPTLNNCTFSANSAPAGGGMFNSSSNPKLTNCIFSGNSANYGGGMANYNNSSPTVTNCTFSSNSANYYGGGINNEDSSSPTIANCTFSGNSAGKDGGGIYNTSNSNPAVTNSTFSSNSATYYGGGMDNDDSNPKLTNCIFWGNSASYGGGMSNQFESSPRLFNCTFTLNAAGQGGGMNNESASSPTITNCILWGDSALSGGEIYNFSAHLDVNPVVTYSDVRGGYSGTGNLNTDPKFVDAANGDVHLQPTSPCLNVGNNTVVTSPRYPTDSNGTIIDLDGNPRITGGTVDLGAYELQNRAPVANAGLDQTPTIPHDGDPTTNTADFTLDGSASSDPDGDSLTYQWFEGQNPIGTGPTLAQSRTAGTYTFTLTVSDGKGGTASDDVQVTVSPEPNGRPTANAGSSQTLEATGPMTSVSLDGSASSDPDHDNLTYEWKEGGASLGTNATLQIGKPVGTYTFALTVTDPYGLSDTKSVQVTVQDTTPPTISGVPSNIGATATSVNGAVVSFPAPSATDLVDGSVPVVCSPASGSQFALGTTTVTCTATDSHGNAATPKTFQVAVSYSWSGFLQPINADGSSVFKAGSTVAVKFQLTGASAGITNAVAKLSYSRVGDAAGTVNEAVSTGTGDAGNQFRYDATSKTYIFNWSTKSATAGKYQLNVDLGDGALRTVTITLR